jgi:hypothetical protein
MNTYTPADSRPRWEPKPYSQNQAELIKHLMAERGITAEALLQVFPQRPTTFKEGRLVIAWLMRQPKTATPSSSPQVHVVDGFYAIPAGELGYDKPHFFRVKNGRKPGVVFLDEQASDDLHRVPFANRKAILEYIAKNAKEARALYGQLIGRCARCRRTLTDHSNPYFEMGLGPECGGKY